MSHDENLPAVKADEEHSQVQVAEPIPDPGIEPHEYRITDIDPKAADRVERQVSTMFTLAGLLALGACVAYFAIPRDGRIVFGPLSGNANNMTIGLCLGLALFLIGALIMAYNLWMTVRVGEAEVQMPVALQPAE